MHGALGHVVGLRETHYHTFSVGVSGVGMWLVSLVANHNPLLLSVQKQRFLFSDALTVWYRVHTSFSREQMYNIVLSINMWQKAKQFQGKNVCSKGRIHVPQSQEKIM